MKLMQEDIKRLYNILNTCSVGEIESIIIEDGIVRGISPDRTCVIISDNEVPDFGKYRVGLSRLPALRARMDLFINDDSVVMDAKETDRGEISQFELSAKQNKVQFRCTAAALIKAPKSINDSGVYIVRISKQQLILLLNAIRVMNAKLITFVIKKDYTVSVHAADSNNDNFVITFDKPAEKLNDEDLDTAVHYFDAAVFVSILKAAISGLDEVSFIVGAAGTLEFLIAGHRIVMLPQVGGEE